MVVVLIRFLFSVYTLLLFARVILSWFPSMRRYRFVQFVGFYTDPYLNLFRRWIPPIGGVLDLSPLLAFFVLETVKQILIALVQ